MSTAISEQYLSSHNYYSKKNDGGYVTSPSTYENIISPLNAPSENYALHQDRVVREQTVLDPYLQARLDKARADYAKKHGNVINYIAGLIEGKTHEDILGDIHTQVIEVPISEVATKYEYRLTWQKDSDKWRFRMGERTLDEIYEDSIYDKTGQIPEFEKERNLNNLENYNILRSGRQRGVNKTFVEFSPSPPMYLPDSLIQPEDRGYWGNDTLFFFSIGEDGHENVEQYWLPGTDMQAYRDFFINELKIPLDPKSDYTPSDIMRMSGFFDQQRIDMIRNFAKARQETVDAVKESEIKNYAHTVVEQQIKTRTTIDVQTAMQRLIKGEDITYNLSKIADTLAAIQFSFRLEIQKMLGDKASMKTDKAYVFGSYGNKVGELTADHFNSLSDDDQMDLMIKNAYVMKGCGMKYSKGSRGSRGGAASAMSNWGINPTSSSFGRSDGMVKMSGGFGDRKDPVICDTCTMFNGWVNNEDPKTWDTPPCKGCGKDMGC